MSRAVLAKLREPYVVGVSARIIGQVISFVSVAVASRYLGLDVFGTFALAWAASVIGNTFVFTGFYQALLRSATFERDRDPLFWLNAGVGALFTLGILGFGLLAGGPATAQGFALVALAPIPLLITPAAWWEAQLVRAKRVRAASLYVLVSEACGLGIAILMLTRGWQIEALIAARYTAVLVGSVLTGALVRTVPRLRIRRDTARAAAGTALPLWGTSSVALFTNYGTDIILGAFASPAMIGAYRGGARIAITASDLVLQPLTMLTWSRFSGIEKSGAGRAAMQAAWVQNMSVGAAILWPMNAAVALMAPELVVTILDETWAPAAGIVAILCVSRAIGFGGALLEPVMMTAGKGRRQMVIRLWGGATLLVLLLAFARFGAEAAAFAHLASSVVVAALSLSAIGGTLELSPARMARSFWPAMALTGLVVAVVLVTEAPFGGLGDATGLMIRIAIITLAWLVLAAVFLQRRILVLPTP